MKLAVSAQHNSLSWLLDPAPLARGLLPPRRLAWNVARLAAVVAAAFFCSSAAFLAIDFDLAITSADEAAFRVRGWASLPVPIH